MSIMATKRCSTEQLAKIVMSAGELWPAWGFTEDRDVTIRKSPMVLVCDKFATRLVIAGQLGFDDDMLLDRISQSFMTRMSHVDATELVNLVRCLLHLSAGGLQHACTQQHQRL